MSALEELWLWLQGSSRTEAGPDAIDKSSRVKQESIKPVDNEDEAERTARIQRNWRYRGGPWQMK